VRKRIGAASLLSLVTVALMLPGTTTAATGYTASIVAQTCLSGGHNIRSEVRLTAAGSTPANKLSIKSTSQYLSGGTWHNFYRWPSDRMSFKSNGQAHSIDYSYTHQDNSDPHHWRIVSVLRAWQGTHVLYTKKLTSKSC